MRLIDSDALEKTLKRNFCEDCNSYNGVRCRACQIGDALDTFEDAPTVEAVPVVHARWSDGLVCSECKCGIMEYCYEQPISEFPYCPFCGARMDGED